eukprot:GHVT01053000.1.p1 GENE.GHVT01053000.1~~GHVT01053000.1.p1  ORF type:complete len:100 (-),score=1.23 GHVT01053000.1:781-1080(-)
MRYASTHKKKQKKHARKIIQCLKDSVTCIIITTMTMTSGCTVNETIMVGFSKMDRVLDHLKRSTKGGDILLWRFDKRELSKLSKFTINCSKISSSTFIP